MKISEITTNEFNRQRDTLNLIASENYPSPAVLNLMGSVWSNKYAEGYPGKRYYAGCQQADILEDYVKELALTVFDPITKEYDVNLQVLSGSPANLTVFLSVLKQNDKVLKCIPSGGGHISHLQDTSSITKALYDIIKGLVSKKHKGDTWSGKYDADMKAVSTCVTKAPDAIAFLTRVIKLLDPTWKPWDQKTPMKPGQWAGLNEPDVPYSAKAQGMLPSPESQKKVELLTQKIADYEAEIKRLKDLQRDAESKAGKAEREREKLATADPKLLKYFSYIDKNCSEFLEHVRNTGKLLYRGQKDASLPIFVGYPRADREPKDSDADAQKLADKVMLLTGFKALRSNSIFTSSNIGQADNYGDVYAIFPKNGFQYTWSTKHDDLVINSVGQLTGEDDGDDDNSAEDAYYEYESYFDNMNHLFYSDKTDLLYKIFDYEVKGFNDPDNKVQSQKATALVKAFMAEPMFKVAKKTLDTWDNVDTYDDTVDDVRKAFVDAIKPVLVLGKKYFDIFQSIGDWDKNTIKNAEKDLKEIEGIAAKAAAEKGKLAGNKLAKEKAEAERIIKNFGFTHENFDAALKARHEICILGEYVAVDWGKYEDEIKKYFLRDASDPKKKVAAKKKPAAKKKTGTNAGKPVKQSGAEDPHLPSGLKDSDFEEDPDVGY